MSWGRRGGHGQNASEALSLDGVFGIYPRDHGGSYSIPTWVADLFLTYEEVSDIRTRALNNI